MGEKYRENQLKIDRTLMINLLEQKRKISFSRDKQEVKETRITQLSLSRAPSNKNAEQPRFK